MKILHICLCGPVTDGWSYQDNLLPKFHRILGNEVTVIASRWVYDEKGRLTRTGKSVYMNQDNVKVVRLESKYGTNTLSKFKFYHGLSASIKSCKPDIIFIHGCQFLDIMRIVKYAKEYPNVKIYVDNHADFSNSASNWLSRNILHKLVWRFCAQKIEPYTTKFYGVLPARVDFLADMYGLPRDKIELLVMGADDDLVATAKSAEARKSIRKKYGISNDDFLIMTGGKVDKNKPQTLLLMEAMQAIKTDKVKLIVFGTVSSEYTENFNELLGDNVIYAGWIQATETYKYFNAADLVVFPGLHSVFWEQVVGLGKPCLFKYIKGFTHVDLGGNCEFLYEDSAEEIKNKIQALIDDTVRYKEMRRVAENKGMDMFSYRAIAEKSLS